MLFELLLFNSNRLDESNRPLNVLVTVLLVVGSSTSLVFFAGSSVLVLKLLVYKGQLFLSTRNLLNEFTFVISLLSNDLATQVLDLRSKPVFDSFSFGTHDISPDGIQFVQNLRDGCLGHLSVIGILNSQNNSNSLSWNPIIVNFLNSLSNYIS